MVTNLDNIPIIRAFLETHSTLALATINPDGQPEVAPLFYVSDDSLNLYWLSATDSRHSTNLIVRERVAATIYSQVWNWTQIKGLQVEGEAQPVHDERVREQMLNLYLRKFPLPESFDSAIASSTLYILKPGWVRWLDNSVAFGYKSEIRL